VRSLKSSGGTSTLTTAQVRTQADNSNATQNDISQAQVLTQVSAGNVAYDAATGTELGVVSGEVDAIATDVDELILEATHLSLIFPESTNETVTFTAGGTNNVFGEWAEIVDNNAVTLSSKAALLQMHISSVMVEDASVKDKMYVLEFGYGEAKTMVARQRYMASDTKVGTTQQIRLRMLSVPAGETIYYRAACETAGATIQAHLRYHTHP